MHKLKYFIAQKHTSLLNKSVLQLVYMQWTLYSSKCSLTDKVYRVVRPSTLIKLCFNEGLLVDAFRFFFTETSTTDCI